MWMSKTEMEIEVSSQVLEQRRRDSLKREKELGVHFNPSRRAGEKKPNEWSIDRLMKSVKREMMYKKSVESMRKAGLIIQIGGSRDGFVANNAPEEHNGQCYGALTLAFGQAVHLACKVTPKCAYTGRLIITYYQILDFIITRLRAWGLSQTPQLSCSCVDMNRKVDMPFEI